MMRLVMNMDEEIRFKVVKVIADVLQGYTLKQAIPRHELSTFSFYNALDQDAKLKQKYELAQEYRSEVVADEILDIADTEPDPAVAKVRIEARKWYASKHKSKKYGDRVDINVNHTIDIVGAISDARQRADAIESYATELPQVSVSEDDPGSTDNDR